MHPHHATISQPVTGTEPVMLLVGNPNVGKSVLFSHLTGHYATVSNYPGTTVEIARGHHRAGTGAVYDLPGINSLTPVSEDERITRDVLLELLGQPDLRVVQVCDAKNLRRGVALALQLAEIEVPMVLLANMADEARARGYRIEGEALREALGVEVLETVAIRREGLETLMSDSVRFRLPSARVHYPVPIAEAAAEIEALLPEGLAGRRGMALLLLAEEAAPPAWTALLGEEGVAGVARIRERLAGRLPESVRVTIGRARYAAAERIVGRVLRADGVVRTGWWRRAGDLAYHPLWGLPIAALVLYGIYLFVGVLGAGKAVDFLQNRVFDEILIPWADRLLRYILPDAVSPFLVGAAGTDPGTGPGLLIGDYGLLSMGLSYAFAIVLPIVGFFFIAFYILEDTGYLPRLAVMLNRVFRLLGLNGKAVLPMILGLGCATMATMTARMLPSRKERVIVTLLLALGVPCSAQLGVVLGMLAALSFGATVLWLGTIVAVMVLVGFLADRVLPGTRSDFVLEIPPLRRPALANIAIKTLARVEWYLREVVPLFLLGSFILWLLDRTALLGVLRRLAAPVVQGLLGLPEQATDAFLMGFLRRDYGAAGLYDLFSDQIAAGTVSLETQVQVVVSLVTITLFVPCIANLFMIIRERGFRTALGISAFILPFAFAVGGALNFLLRGVLL